MDNSIGSSALEVAALSGSVMPGTGGGSPGVKSCGVSSGTVLKVSGGGSMDKPEAGGMGRGEGALIDKTGKYVLQ